MCYICIGTYGTAFHMYWYFLFRHKTYILNKKLYTDFNI